MTFTGNRRVTATATARRAFFPGGGEWFLQHFDLQRLAAEQTLQFAHPLFELACPAGGDHIFIGTHGDLAALGHQLPPLEQQARRDAALSGDDRDRRAGLHRLHDESQFLLGTVAPVTLTAGDDFNTAWFIGHRRMPRL